MYKKNLVTPSIEGNVNGYEPGQSETEGSEKEPGWGKDCICMH